MLLIARSSRNQKAAFEWIRKCETMKFRYFETCEAQFQGFDQKVMDWLLAVLPPTLKAKVEAASRKGQRDGVLLSGRQGLHITRRAMRSYGEETLLDERKKFELLQPRGDAKNGKFNKTSMIEFRERHKAELT